MFVSSMFSDLATSLSVSATRRRAFLGLVAVLAVALPSAFLAARLWMPLPFLNDNLRLRLPAMSVISLSWAEGMIPLWDPYTGGGVQINSLYTPFATSPVMIAPSAFGTYTTATLKCEVMLYMSLLVVGMYVWLASISAREIAAVLAPTLALAAPAVIAAQLNVEMLASVASLPWTVLALTRCLRGDRDGGPLLALSLGFMGTCGYLGLNVLMVELAVLFVVAWFVTGVNDRDGRVRPAATTLPTRLRAALIAILPGLALTVGMLAFVILETCANVPTDVFLARQIDPHEGSLGGSSWLTLFCPIGVDPFASDEHGGVPVVLFAGSSIVVALLAACFRPRLATGVCLTAACFVYLASLSSEYACARLLTQVLPFFRHIRWHFSLGPMIQFFLVSAAATAIAEIQRRPLTRVESLAATAVGFLVTVGTAFRTGSDGPIPIDRPQDWGVIVAWLGLSGVIMLLVALLPALSWDAASDWKPPVTWAALCLLQAVQMTWSAHLSVSPYLYEGLGPIDREKQAAVRAEIERTTVNSFELPADNQRRPHGYERIINHHYFLKQAVVESYFPNVHPAARAIVRKHGRGAIGRFFEVDDETSIPLPVTFRRFDLQSCEATIDVPEAVSALRWNTPFASAWRARIDGRPVGVRRTADGLMSIDITPGRHHVGFTYRPWYLVWALLLSTASWTTAVAWLTWGMARLRTVWSPADPPGEARISGILRTRR